jgi:hypothetical protein
MTEQIKYYLTRHGKKNPEGDLSTEAIPGIYNSGRQYLSAFFRNRYNNRAKYVIYTSTKRTLDTGKVILAGALGLDVPRSIEDIDRMKLGLDSLDSNVLASEEPRLSYDKIALDLDYVKQVGQTAYFNEWIQNPTSKQLGKNPITSWNQAKRITKNTLNGYLLKEFVDSAVVVTHGGIIEPLFAKIIESTRKRTNPIRSLDEIGGQFAEGECAVLTFKRSNGLYSNGTLKRSGQTYPVDMANLLCFPCENP